jgi:nonsense-mediated mRNA decay protein 3
MKSCPACGKREAPGESPFVGAFCADCCAKSSRVYEIRAPLQVERCQKCGRVRLSGNWVERDSGALEKIISSKIRSPFEFGLSVFATSEEKNKIIVQLEGKFEIPPSAVAKKKIRAAIKVKPATCQDCGRRSGGYYEAIIQLRGPLSKVEREAGRIADLAERFGGFAVKVEELKEGTDLYISSDRAARLAMAQRGMHWKHSAKLAGMKAGKKLLRRSYCVRL